GGGTYGRPPIVSVTATAGLSVPTRPAAGVPATIGSAPARGTFVVTTAKRIDPSGQRTFTSVCVGSAPTLTADVAAPCGSARPNVAHPFVNVFAASTRSSACAGCATAVARQTAAIAHLHRAAHERHIRDSPTIRGQGQEGCRDCEFAWRILPPIQRHSAPPTGSRPCPAD